MRSRSCGVFVVVLLLVATLSRAVEVRPTQEKMDFWATQRKGANCFNVTIDEAWFKDASRFGIEWVRLAYEKWPGKQRDFLMGNADHFSAIDQEDLRCLKQALDWAHSQNLKVVIAPLGLPGNRWVQKNGGQHDLRLWQDKVWWGQAVAFWRELAVALKDHPAVYGYNILNEPTPEMNAGLPEESSPERFREWYAKIKGTARDLPRFYETVIAAIREVDSHTPIIVDSGWYARPAAFSCWPRPADDKVLFSVHMYEPYEFTNHRNFKKPHPEVYPGPILFDGKKTEWNRKRLEEYFFPFFSWAASQGIPAHRLMVGEFGCYRRNPGCAAYLADVIAVLNSRAVHWAFYSFREDEWDGFDYEVGTGGLSEKYWREKDAGKNPAVPRSDNPLIRVLRQEFSFGSPLRPTQGSSSPSRGANPDDSSVCPTDRPSTQPAKSSTDP